LRSTDQLITAVRVGYRDSHCRKLIYEQVHNIVSAADRGEQY
jgi:hypothetical protein